MRGQGARSISRLASPSPTSSPSLLPTSSYSMASRSHPPPPCRYGMVLKQSANFYNNISTEMIPCQKPMMLKDALEFEKVWGRGVTHKCGHGRGVIT